jgi:hypothetical protein
MIADEEPGGTGAQNPTESGGKPSTGANGARVNPASPAKKKSEALAAALRANLARRKARARALRDAGTTDDSEA